MLGPPRCKIALSKECGHRVAVRSNILAAAQVLTPRLDRVGVGWLQIFKLQQNGGKWSQGGRSLSATRQITPMATL